MKKQNLLSYLKKDVLEAGCDEAGRGCLAGPVFAAAVILPSDFNNPMLDDSKKLSEKNREALRPIIEEEAISWAVAMLTHIEIDKINILNASIMAMQKALSTLDRQPEHIIIDGNRFKPYGQIPYKCIIKGDGKYYSIAAASVLAKTYRDDYMKKIHEELPVYDWKQNKGYPTRNHRLAIEEHGISNYHRRSFNLIPEQLKLKFK